MSDLSLDASILGSEIRLGQSEIGRILSLAADIYNRQQREPGREETIVIYGYQYDIIFTMFLTKKREKKREI